MYSHRSAPMLTPRYLELLELLKSEFEGLHQEATVNRLHRDDSDPKVHGQLLDLGSMQKALFELEKSYYKMKQQFEDEISRLKNELESHGLGTTSSAHPTSAAIMVQFPTIPNLELELQSFASGFANLSNGHAEGGGGGSSGGSGGYLIKRPHEDDLLHPGRNIRMRDESQAILPRRASASASSSSIPIRTTHGPITETSKKETSSPNIQVRSTNFDWLVVYNPKAVRSVAIDLYQTFAHESVVCCVRFSNDGKYLATGSNRMATIFDLASGEKVAVFKDTENVEKDADQYIRSVAFSSDGKYLVTGSEDQIVRVWDIESQSLKCRLTGHTQDIYSVEFMPNGATVISGSGDRSIRIWEIENGNCLMTLTIPTPEPGKDAGITSISVSPNGKYVAAGSLDRTIRIWEVETGKALDTLDGHRDSVYSVQFTPDGKSLLSGSLDKTIKVWQLSTPDNLTRASCKYTILGHKDFVLSVAGTPPDGRWIISGSKDRSVQFWDSQSGTTQLMLQGHKNSVISVTVSPNGEYFATGSGDCRARVWSYNITNDSPNPNGSSGSVTGIPPAQPLTKTDCQS